MQQNNKASGKIIVLPQQGLKFVEFFCLIFLGLKFWPLQTMSSAGFEN